MSEAKIREAMALMRDIYTGAEGRYPDVSLRKSQEAYKLLAEVQGISEEEILISTAPDAVVMEGLFDAVQILQLDGPESEAEEQDRRAWYTLLEDLTEWEASMADPSKALDLLRRSRGLIQSHHFSKIMQEIETRAIDKQILALEKQAERCATKCGGG